MDAERQPERPQRGGLLLGRILGVPVRVSMAWVVVAVLLIIVYAPLARARVPGLSVTGSYFAAVGFIALLLVSVLLHELGHAVAAQRHGIGVRGMTLWMLGGYTELEHEPRTPRSDLFVSLAGPVVSLLLGGVGLALFSMLDAPSVLRELTFQFTFANLGVGVFNLLPGLPLDGGVLVRAGVWRISGSRDRATVAAGWCGRVIAVAVIASGVVIGYLRLGSNVGVLFTIAVGAFLWMGATRAIQAGTLAVRLPMLNARSLARPAITAAADLPLAEAIRRAQAAEARAIVVVDGTGRAAGLVAGHAAAAVPEQRRPWIPVSSVSRSVEPGMIIPADLAGEPLLHALHAHPATEYLVGEIDRVVGVLVATDVADTLDPKGSIR